MEPTDREESRDVRRVTGVVSEPWLETDRSTEWDISTDSHHTGTATQRGHDSDSGGCLTVGQRTQEREKDEVLSLETGIEAFETSSTFRGPVEPVDGHPCNDHFALIYETRAEQLDAIAPFLAQGLERGERCLCVLDELTETEVLTAIRQTDIDIEAAIDGGSLVFNTVAETYLQDGGFDPDGMVDRYDKSISEATDEYAGLRIVAETTWLQKETTSFEQFMEYEAKVNTLFDDEDCIALCLYDRTTLEPEAVREIVRTHPHLIYDNTVCNNLYYTPPAEYLAENGAEGDVERMLQTLTERTEAKTTLRDREAFLRELYETTAAPNLTFHEKIETMLSLGRDRFDLDVGYFAAVDVDTNQFEVLEAVGSHPKLQAGFSGQLSGTCCEQALDADQSAGIFRAVNDCWGSDETDERHTIDACIGTSLAVGDDLYGTLCFGTVNPGTEPFTELRQTFVELMGEWIGNELDRNNREQQLERYREYTGDILDSLGDLFYVIDSEWNLARWNQSVQKVTGYSEEEIDGMDVIDFFEGENRQAILAGIETVFETGDNCLEAELETKDGTSIPYEFVASRLENPNGEQVVAGIARDITERKEHERYQRELYEVTSDNELDFDEKIERVLELGCERFGLDQGYVTRYHPDEDVLESTHVVGPAGLDRRTGIAQAQADPGQFCRRALGRAEAVCAPDIRDCGREDDPVSRECGVQSYFGVGITNGAGPCGTLAFCDIETRAEAFTEAEQTFLELMGQWVSHALEQQRSQEQLAALNGMSRELMNAETLPEIATVTVEHAHESLRLPLSAVIRYDDETGQLTPAARTPRAADELSIASLCDGTRGPAWKAFVEDEWQVVDTEGIESHSVADDLTQLVAVPLAQQGVFVAATTTAGGFSATELDFVGTTAATVEAACTRTDREQLLHEREATLEKQNETLERLNRINTTIRDIHQSLVQATTREEIEQVVCEQLAKVGPYELAWVGEHDTVTGEVTPRESAGKENGYLDEISITIGDEPKGLGPAGRAIKTREPQTANDILSDSSFAPWRQSALNRGYHSVMSLPLEYDETLYGILVVYASQPGVFDDLERTVLTEMADTIAHTMNAVESKKALVSDEVTELEFTIDGTELPLLQLARTTGCQCSIETLVPQQDGGFRGFFSTRGTTADEVLEFGPQLPVSDLTVLSEQTESGETVCLLEAALGPQSLPSTVLEHGGQLEEFRADDETAHVTVHLASEAEIREFVAMFQAKYSDATLTAQRSFQRTQQTSQEFQAAVLEELTARQLEVLQSAYFNGYFEEPRVRSASEIADTLDITQPTFNSHARAAQRKLFRHLFEEDSLQV